MRSKILSNFKFATDSKLRKKLALISDDIVIADYGIQCKACPKKRIALDFSGYKLPVIHTSSGDSIELIFMPQGVERGRIYFGFTVSFRQACVDARSAPPSWRSRGVFPVAHRHRGPGLGG